MAANLGQFTANFRFSGALLPGLEPLENFPLVVFEIIFLRQPKCISKAN